MKKSLVLLLAFLVSLTCTFCSLSSKAQSVKCYDSAYKKTYDTTIVDSAYKPDSFKIAVTAYRCNLLCQLGLSKPKPYTDSIWTDTLKLYTTSTKESKTKDTSKLHCDTINDAKHQLAGLMVRSYDWIIQNPFDATFFKAVNGIVIRINWSDLQPTENGPLNTSYIDGAISWANSIKQQYGIDIYFKLRILNGINAPDWLKNKCGSFALNAGDSKSQSLGLSSGTCSKFWVQTFIDAWANLQTKLAALYDNNDRIVEVVNSATAVGSGEALIRGAGNAGALGTNTINYLSAGYSSSADLLSVYASINAMKVWKRTNIGMSLTPWQVISTKVSEEDNTTALIADSLCKAFGSRAVIGNNGLRTGDGKEGADWVSGGIMYDIAMHFIEDKAKYGSSIFYQTATDWRTGVPVTDVLNQGLLFDASCIELPNTQKIIQQNISADQLQYYDAALLANDTGK